MTPPQEPTRRRGAPHDGLARAEALARALADGPVAVATVVRARGSHPRAVGAKVLVPKHGTPQFSIGGGALEASVIADCRRVLDGEEPGLRRYDLSETGDDSVGMTCGGSVEVFIDLESPPLRLFVLGAGHVGRAVAAGLDTLLPEMVDQLRTVLGTEIVWIMLLDDDSRKLRIAEASGRPHDVVARACVPLGKGVSGEGVPGQVAQRGEPCSSASSPSTPSSRARSRITRISQLRRERRSLRRSAP